MTNQTCSVSFSFIVCRYFSKWRLSLLLIQDEFYYTPLLSKLFVLVHTMSLNGFLPPGSLSTNGVGMTLSEDSACDNELCSDDDSDDSDRVTIIGGKYINYYD